MGYCILRSGRLSGAVSSKLIIQNAQSIEEAHVLAKQQWGDVPMKIYSFLDVLAIESYMLVLEIE